MLNARDHCEACGWEGEGPQVAHDLSRWHVPEPVRPYWACPVWP
jgi:hypothetical protein